jgi:tRNA pseudouridine55 synthase
MAHTRRGRPVNGWLALDKPLGMTSTAAVGAVKRLFEAAKAGHAGTLDPLATGILPIALGEATKTVAYAMDSAKAYRFTVRWGAETTTDDAEGTVVESSNKRPARLEIETLLPHFTGVIDQVPPQFSAIKVAGERAYDLARSGEMVELAARPVEISSLRLVVADSDSATLEAECGKGAYVRAIARDMGRQLGVFGHVMSLRRTRVGPFGEAQMISLEMLQDLRHKGPGREAIDQVLLPVATALDDIPALAVATADAARLKQGQSVILRGANAPVAEPVVLVTWQGEAVAIGEIAGGVLRARRVLSVN